MIAKIVDGITIFPTEDERQKIVITNPTDEVLKFNMGYKDFISDVKPEYNTETQYLEPYYEETDVITRHYRVIENV